MKAQMKTQRQSLSFIDTFILFFGMKRKPIEISKLRIDGIFKTFERELKKLKDIKELQNKAIAERVKTASDKKIEGDKKIQDKNRAIEEIKKAMNAEIKRIEDDMSMDIKKTESEIKIINDEKERTDRVTSRIEEFLK